ncbi:hypothetical protein AAF712_010208 [Marasmius tenuissimus]|uniref:Uncharacterized protein n=1 Tax=Marasmius tenuissimus TaxID=585030 RepID=A0ABR2ZP08_9AGAR
MGKSILQAGGIMDASEAKTRLRIQGLLALYRSLNVSVIVYWGSIDNFPTNSLCLILSQEGNLWTIQHQEAYQFAKLVPAPGDMDSLLTASVLFSTHQDLQWPEPVSSQYSESASPQWPEPQSPQQPEPSSSQQPEPLSMQWPVPIFNPAVKASPPHINNEETKMLVEKDSGQLPAKKPCPGRKGPSVWYWEQKGKLRVRTLITHKEHEWYWSCYGFEQKVYDAWANCWDVCTEFGDHDDNNYDYDYDVDEDVSTVPPTGGMPVNTSAPCVSGTPELPADSQATEEGALKEGELADEPPSMEGSSVRSDSGKALGVLGEQGATEYKVENLRMTVETVAHERYGYTGNPVELGPANEQLTWAATTKLLGNGRWFNNPENAEFIETWPADTVQAHLSRHLYLIQKSPAHSADGIPSLDLSDRHNFIHSHGSWPFFVRKVPVDGVTWYMLSEKSGPLSAKNHLLIVDLVAVVQVAARDQFLRSSRGQAAVTLGGILGRIARELVVDSDMIFGPDMDVVYGRGQCFLDTMEGGYWDDELSEEEIDLICSVYVIEKGSCPLALA